MATLESTPQRVFFLINNVDKSEGNSTVWDMRITNNDEDLTTEYMEIIAEKKPDDVDFTSVIVKATKVKEVVLSNPELGTIDRNLTREDLEPMYWNDIDDHIVKIVNNYYEADDSRRELRERLIDYADSMEEFVSYNVTNPPEIDENGLISFTLFRLPLVTKDEEDDDEIDITVKSVESLDDYEIEITSDNSSTVFTLKELNRLMDKSIMLDEILNYMKKYV